MNCEFKCRMNIVIYVCFYVFLLAGIITGKPSENGNGVVNMEIQSPDSQGDTTTPSQGDTTTPNQGDTTTPKLKAQTEPDGQVANEQVRKLGEVDWGQADGDNGWEERKLQEQGRQEKEEATGSEAPQLGSTLNIDQQDTGVVNPEHLLHEAGADGHHHGDAHGEAQADPAQAMQAVMKDGEAKEQAERETLDGLRPGVLKNVHDGPSRSAAEIMRSQQFGPGGIEEVMHGGHHVHGEGHETRPVQGGDVEAIVHGEEGVHEDHDSESDDKKKKSLSTFDPDQLMHAEGEGHDCGGKPCFKVHEKADQVVPGGMPPEDTLLRQGLKTEDKPKENVEKKPFGTDPEKELHGDDHAHDHHDDDPNYKPKNKITYKDIIDLGLSEEQLKGIDLSKLLEQEKKEFDNWQMKNENSDPAYWQEQAKDLRKEYLEKIYSKIKHISQPLDDNMEWEVTEDEVHKGESNVEHEMEMWGRTEPKSHRQPYEALHGRRGMNEEVQEQQGEEASQDEPQPEEEPAAM